MEASKDNPVVGTDRVNVIMTCPKAFRCYDIETKEMHYEAHLLEVGVVMTANGILLLDGEPVPTLVPLWNTSQQDTHGNALYEGDICEMEIETGFGVMQRVGVMRWSPKYNNFSLNFNGRSLMEGGANTRMCQLIGNEYQDKQAVERYRADNM